LEQARTGIAHAERYVSEAYEQQEQAIAAVAATRSNSAVRSRRPPSSDSHPSRIKWQQAFTAMCLDPDIELPGDECAV
jgi:hypothetical protein